MQSEFTGSTLKYILINLASGFLIGIAFGLGAPLGVYFIKNTKLTTLRLAAGSLSLKQK